MTTKSNTAGQKIFNIVSNLYSMYGFIPCHELNKIVSDIDESIHDIDSDYIITLNNFSKILKLVKNIESSDKFVNNQTLRSCTHDLIQKLALHLVVKNVATISEIKRLEALHGLSKLELFNDHVVNAIIQKKNEISIKYETFNRGRYVYLAMTMILNFMLIFGCLITTSYAISLSIIAILYTWYTVILFFKTVPSNNKYFRRADIERFQFITTTYIYLKIAITTFVLDLSIFNGIDFQYNIAPIIIGFLIFMYVTIKDLINLNKMQRFLKSFRMVRITTMFEITMRNNITVINDTFKRMSDFILWSSSYKFTK